MRRLVEFGQRRLPATRILAALTVAALVVLVIPAHADEPAGDAETTAEQSAPVEAPAEPVAEEPAPVEPAPEEPVAEEPAPVEPAPEEPVAEEPVAEEQPAAEEPDGAVGQPVRVAQKLAAVTASSENGEGENGEREPEESQCPADKSAVRNASINGNQASFRIIEGCEDVPVVFASYSKLEADRDLEGQVLFDYVQGLYDEGVHSVQIALPPCFYQVDLAYGDVIPVLSRTVKYGNRLLRFVHGGQECTPEPHPAAEVGFDCLEQSPEARVTESADLGATLSVTYGNTGDAPADMILKINDEQEDSLTVPAGGTETRHYSVAAFEDQTITVTVLSGELTLVDEEFFVDCETEPTPTPTPTPNPDVQVADIVCVESASSLELSYFNTGSRAASFVTKFQGVQVDALTVPAGGSISKTYDVSAYEDQTVSVEVTSGAETFAFERLVDCVPDVGPTPTEPPTQPPPTVEPTQSERPNPPNPNPPGPSDGPDTEPEVLGAPETAVLPFTGSTLPMWFAWALGLIGAGLALVGLVRRRASGGDTRKG